MCRIAADRWKKFSAPIRSSSVKRHAVGACVPGLLDINVMTATRLSAIPTHFGSSHFPSNGTLLQHATEGDFVLCCPVALS